MLQNIGSASSPAFHGRLSKLDAASRAQVIADVEKMRSMFVEEITAKFLYWDELPHVALGMYPNDSESHRYAQIALQSGMRLHSDRFPSSATV